ncbi:phage tail protein [Pandoraea sp. ISTKB]|uniref:phage tail protein n=1 Tax=Pandoraea sp. ISTKB TaxID=1586708 RepID=UPI0008476407|nr:tail fiber protein [Pandoraea sp. ISTKB]ODP34338.1 hypothetical protein A9762_15265 [Pandoraea sp. ISTKB]
MDEYYIGEVRIFACNFAPSGWVFCDGTILQIRSFPTLFAVIGNLYGGDGKLTFAVPDLRGQIAQGMTAPTDMYKRQGSETVTLDDTQVPLHTHTAYVNGGRPSSLTPGDRLPMRFFAGGNNTYLEDTALQSPVSLSPQAISVVGNGGSHNNMQPFLPMNFCIAVQYGEFPPRP